MLYLFIEEYTHSGIKEFPSFARGLLKDIDAVENAVASPLSDGFVEGTNNKLKMIKRMMYGRCGIMLLRAKLMLEPKECFIFDVQTHLLEELRITNIYVNLNVKHTTPTQRAAGVVSLYCTGLHVQPYIIATLPPSMRNVAPLIYIDIVNREEILPGELRNGFVASVITGVVDQNVQGTPFRNSTLDSGLDFLFLAYVYHKSGNMIFCNAEFRNEYVQFGLGAGSQRDLRA